MLVIAVIAALLMVDPINADVCSHTLTAPQTLEQHEVSDQSRCEFYLEAPADHIINITVTRLFGFPPTSKRFAASASDSDDARDCLPRIDFTEIMSSGRERSIEKLCALRQDAQASGTGNHVIISDTHLVKLTFDWPSGHKSGFVINFVFVKQLVPCEFRCLDGSCLPANSLVCNAVQDCLDGSDEDMCPHESTGDNSVLEILIIVPSIVVVVIFLAVTACCVTQFRLPTRLSEYRSRRDSSATDNNHLNPASPQPSSTEVVYVPQSPSHGRSSSDHRRDEHSAASGNIRMEAVDVECAHLPPHIPRSLDGEEGYYASQRNLLLQPPGDETFFTVAPNRVVGEGESPAPHRQRSASAGMHPSHVSHHHKTNSYLNGPRCHTTVTPIRGQWTAGGMPPVYSPPGMYQTGQRRLGVLRADGAPPDYNDVVSSYDRSVSPNRLNRLNNV